MIINVQKEIRATKSRESFKIYPLGRAKYHCIAVSMLSAPFSHLLVLPNQPLSYIQDYFVSCLSHGSALLCSAYLMHKQLFPSGFQQKVDKSKQFRMQFSWNPCNSCPALPRPGSSLKRSAPCIFSTQDLRAQWLAKRNTSSIFFWVMKNENRKYF